MLFAQEEYLFIWRLEDGSFQSIWRFGCLADWENRNHRFLRNVRFAHEECSRAEIWEIGRLEDGNF
jgi:hypothetical protein